MTGAEAGLDRVFDLDQLEALAVEAMSPAARVFVQGGAGQGLALRANLAAWRRWALQGRVLRDVSRLDTQTSVLGTPLATPVMIAPSGLHTLLHPEGEVATARAARQTGTILVLSEGTTCTIDSVAGATGAWWLQLYWTQDRALLRDLLARAEQSGCAAVCITVDAPVRPWLHAAMRHALAALGAPEPIYFKPIHHARDTGWDHDARVTWDDLAWLGSVCRLPIVLKGITAAPDARLAAEHGIRCIIVSNHGGRMLDEAPGTAEVLPEVVAAVDGQTEVLVDGGIRRGSDVFKALALGARAVLVGRPVLWGLAVGGSDGVVHALDILRGELLSVMGMCGTPTLGSIGPDSLRPRSLDTRD